MSYRTRKKSSVNIKRNKGLSALGEYWMLYVIIKQLNQLKGSVRKKLKGEQANVELNSIVIATNLTAYTSYAYKEKVVKHTPQTE